MQKNKLLAFLFDKYYVFYRIAFVLVFILLSIHLLFFKVNITENNQDFVSVRSEVEVFKNAKNKFMTNDTVEGADLAYEIAPYILNKINKKKIPLMIALLNAITKNKKLNINY